LIDGFGRECLGREERVLGKREESAWEENKKVISISFEKVPHQRQISPLIHKSNPSK
jgi:hypothetical protein